MCFMEKFKTLMKEFQGDKIVQRQDQKLLEKGARQVTILKWDFPPQVLQHSTLEMLCLENGQFHSLFKILIWGEFSTIGVALEH